MRRIVVTPAGRKRYLEVLIKNLLREKKDFDEWHLWMNTNVESDIEYCRCLARDHRWISLVEIPDINEVSNSNIHKFFKYAQEEDSVYVRLDDDVVFLDEGFFENLLKYRLANKKPFIVFANIINNAVISHIHQRNGLINHPELCGYDCLDKIGWEDGLFAEKVHRAFVKDLKSGDLDKWRSSFNKWVCYQYERISINAISWMGYDMADIKAEIAWNEEEYLTVDLPRRMGRPSEIFGGALAVHFAFYKQREYMDRTDLLKEYSKLVDF